ncbi:hypothetical protein [Clostridium sp. YIM B02500]|uniref:hypothetical protein n=1 Tax=Clostridium sp. YIM B02500 TaxID=2910681 RepID=UPI001EED0972|nr:hypothetical protein [Clostridium sp. YIM B02500]
MKAYKIYISDNYGFEMKEEYASTYSKAIQILNNKIRKAVKQLKGDLVRKEDFSEEIQRLREDHPWNGEIEIISRKMPYILYKRKNELIATIPYWEKTSYEYDEWDVVSEDIILKEIEIQS